MIGRNHPLPIAHQAKIAGISRGAVYYVPRPIGEADLALMRRIDELPLEHPFMGAGMLRRELAKEGIEVRRRQIGTLHAADEHSRTSAAARHQQALSWAHPLPVPAAPRLGEP